MIFQRILLNNFLSCVFIAYKGVESDKLIFSSHELQSFDIVYTRLVESATHTISSLQLKTSEKLTTLQVLKLVCKSQHAPIIDTSEVHNLRSIYRLPGHIMLSKTLLTTLVIVA